MGAEEAANKIYYSVTIPTLQLGEHLPREVGLYAQDPQSPIWGNLALNPSPSDSRAFSAGSKPSWGLLSPSTGACLVLLTFWDTENWQDPSNDTTPPGALPEPSPSMHLLGQWDSPSYSQGLRVLPSPGGLGSRDIHISSDLGMSQLRVPRLLSSQGTFISWTYSSPCLSQTVTPSR